MNFGNKKTASGFEAPTGRIAARVYWLAAVLIVLAGTSLLLVGYVASSSADRQALENETLIFDNALRDRQLLIARDQLSLAQWDRSVAHVSKSFDEDFVAEELVDSLWYDFGLHRSYLVGPDDRLLASSVEHQVDFTKRALKSDDPLKILADRTRAKFETNRVRLGDGYGQKTTTAAHVADVTEFAFARIDGKAMLLSAMAIVPDDGEITLDEGTPVILVSAKALDADFVKDLNAPLSLNDMTFLDKALPEGTAARRAIIDIKGHNIGHFSWTHQTPGQKIWSLIIPLAMGLSAFLAFAAMFLARKIGKLSETLEESESRNRYFALHDPLSGLANRIQFSDQLSHAIDQLPEREFALIACDLDRFKDVNDTYGHAAGDMVIRTVADRLTAIVEDSGIVGRIGGDEFVILVRRTPEPAKLDALAEEILHSISRPMDIGENIRTNVGISLGIATAPYSGLQEAKIIAAADAALYDAKEGGRNRAVFYETSLRPQLEHLAASRQGAA